MPRQIFQRYWKSPYILSSGSYSYRASIKFQPKFTEYSDKVEEGRQIRKAFVAKENCKIIAADYSQIELRIMAHLSGDQGLISAFKDGLDIHKTTASEIFQLSLDE